MSPPLLLCGDVKIEFSSKRKLLDNFGLMKEKEFHFWFNTFFVDSPFSSDLSYSVTPSGGTAGTSSPNCSVEEAAEDEDDETTGSSSHEGLVMRDSLGSSDSGRLIAPQANGAAVGGGLRSYPAPERHASCAGGAAQTDGKEDEAVSLARLVKNTSISDDHLLQQENHLGAPLTAPVHSESQRPHLPVRHTHSHHLQQQHSHGVGQQRPHTMATSTSSSSSSSSNSGAASATTLLSFNEIRKRHTSMPQTAIRVNPSSKHSSAVFDRRQRLLEPPPSLADLPPGLPVSLRLGKGQVDKAFKDKQCKVYPGNFQIHLFLLKPDDQVCQTRYTYVAQQYKEVIF